MLDQLLMELLNWLNKIVTHVGYLIGLAMATYLIYAIFSGFTRNIYNYFTKSPKN